MRPYKTAENKIDGVLMALMDIDVMKHGLDQARLSLDDAVAGRDLSAKLLNMSGALIVILDPAASIIAFNHACQEMSGYSFREVKGRPFGDVLLPPEEADEAKAALAGILEGAEPTSTHERTRGGKDGSRKVIASSTIVRRRFSGVPRGPENGHVGKRSIHAGTDAARLLRRQLRSLRERVDGLSDDLRSAAHRLHPSALEHLALVAALESHCSDFMKLHHIQVKLTQHSVPESIPLEVTLCLTQACLNNIAKHSGAKEAAVATEGREGDILLSITDNRTGFDPGLVAEQSGLGIVGIRDRIRLVDGSVSINSQPGNGTQIEVRVPPAKSMGP